MKHNRFKKIVACFLIAIHIFSTLAICSNAENIVFPYYNGEITSKAAIVMDLNSSIILYDHNSDVRLYPASLAKIMTAIIVLENANGTYDDMVNFSYNAITQDIDRTSTTVGATAGDQLSVKDCLYSLLLASANDVANALAEHVAGSVKDFVLLMNERAETLGCKDTHFVNPSGLHDDDQYTTASDMAKILKYAMSYPIYMQIASSVSYRHAPIRRFKDPENSNNQVLNTSSIVIPGSVYYYSGITSAKTGHTKLAGYNIAASARKHDMNLICVLLGANNDKTRYSEIKSLFDFYFDNYQSLKIKDVDTRFNDNLSNISIDDVDLVETLNITCDDESHVTIPNGINLSNITSKISYQVEDAYNKYAIGTIHYYLDDTFIGQCSIEGKNLDAPEAIFTSNLDLTSQQNDDSADANSNTQNDSNTTNNSLIYRNNSGNLIISGTLISLITIIIIFALIIAFCMFLYVKVLTNSNIPIQKLFFRLRRRFRR